MAKRKPFFSIVIPCYNDGRYNNELHSYIFRALCSICNQGLKKSETEIIIADDCSPVSYDSILKKFNQKLNIIVVKTDHNFAPGNTRQKGVESATGKWVCFIDHDDFFCDNALLNVKCAIEAANEQNMVVTDFDKVDPEEDMKVIEEIRGTDLKTWIYGKFYNLDNFWKANNVHFIQDLETCESHALSKYVECALSKMRVEPLYLSEVTYKWVYNRDSVSHSKYFLQGSTVNDQQRNFLRTHFRDSVSSQITPVLEAYQNQLLSKGDALAMIVPSLIGYWRTLNNFNSDKISHYMQINDAYCSKAWSEVKSIIGCNLPILKVMLVKAFNYLLDKANQIAEQESIPISFIEWLTEIDTMNYSKIIEDAQNVNVDVEGEQTEGHRPFFSCIIPCYNDGRYKDGVYLDRLLSSLTRQDVPKEDLEVILSDDCSPVSFYSDLKKKYDEYMILKYVKTDYNFAPGNTRAKGLTIATGIWLCFADHDDIYYDGALKQVYQSITEKQEKHFAFGDFNGVNPEGEVVRKYECTLNWCHAKFYNKDNFWDKYGLHFIKDLKSHEDIAICTQVSCALSANISQYTYIHVPLYAWTDNPQSVSHAKYTVETETGPREFLEVFYGDYIQATGYMYLEQFKDHRIKITYAIKSVLEIMCYAYFYQQGFMFRRPDDYYKKNLEIAGDYIRLCKEAFNLNNNKIYDVVSSNRAEMYYKVAEQAKMATGRYMPTQTFRQWLDEVSPET